MEQVPLSTLSLDSTRSSFKILLENWRPVGGILLFGFSAGLPILLIFSSLSIWLTEAGVGRGSVTFFSWAALGYSFKFVWAPLVDKLPIPLLSAAMGKRRSWLLVAQLAVICSIVSMALNDPLASDGLRTMAIAALALGFSSATQDIVIDAYRIESADSDVQALMSSSYVAGYRIGMFVAGAVALYLASWFGSSPDNYSFLAWRNTYLIMAGCMSVGLLMTFLAAEPARRDESSYIHGTADYLRFLLVFLLFILSFVGIYKWVPTVLDILSSIILGGEAVRGLLASFVFEVTRMLLSLATALSVVFGLVRIGVASRDMIADTYVGPIADFFRRYGRAAVLILLLIGFYRVSDIVLGVISNVFYLDMGFSKNQIATVTKVFGLWMTILGGFLGGILAIRFGVMRILMVGAVLTVLTNLLFILLANNSGDIWLLYWVIGADNLTAGLASAAFIAYLSSLTSLSFTAVQYAVFSSLMTLFPKLLGGYSGQIVDAVGYSQFFLGASLIGVPVFLLVWLCSRLEQTRAS